VILGSEAELAASMRAKLARVGREGGKQPLLAAATVALLCEHGELARDDSNGVCLCWVDMDTGTLVAEGAHRRPGVEADVDGDSYGVGVPAGGAVGARDGGPLSMAECRTPDAHAVGEPYPTRYPGTPRWKQ
jgi:hypothetical protein